jgi:peptide/nickel transport system substrate-binding protein
VTNGFRTEDCIPAAGHRRLDRVRQRCTEVENHVIDEYVGGRLTRRDFLRRGALVGLSLPALGAVLAACGPPGTPSTSTGSGARGKPGATIRAGILVPTGAIDPVTVADQGGHTMLAQTGEYLCLADQQLMLRPVLATSWKPNADASAWTFTIRPGVRFSDGRPMTVDDVVYTFKSQCDPKNGANALSAFGGVMLPDGVVKTSETTVTFYLESRNGHFPYLCSTDNYNMVIVPDKYDFQNWQESFIGTGPFIKESYTPNVGATFARNPGYWGPKALPARTEFTFYPAEAPMTAALEAGGIDVQGQFSVVTSPQLLDGGFTIIGLRSSTHRELSMRNDVAPFTSRYVRQAIACTLDRPQITRTLFRDYAEIGNDSPFAPVFASTNTTVPQRARNITLARQLLAKAGVPNGFAARLITETTGEIPDLAQIIAASARQIGVDITLTIETPAKFFGRATFGDSDWLDGEMSLVDYGARSVPDVFLEAPLQTISPRAGQGSWNAARFSNSTYDTLSKQYIAALDLSSQRRIAGQIETLLLDETPVIYPYFCDFLTATTRNITGVYPTGIGDLFLYNAGKDL